MLKFLAIQSKSSLSPEQTDHASVAFSLSSMEYISERDGEIFEVLPAASGLGDRTPLRDLTALGERKVA